MNTLLFSLLLTTAVPDDLTVEQFLEMLQRTSEIYDNTQIVYEREGQRLPEFDSEEAMAEYLEKTSPNPISPKNESYKKIAKDGLSFSGKRVIVTRDYDTYRKESISRTGITNMVFIMDNDLEYIYDPATNRASIDHRSYRTRYGIPFLRFEKFTEYDKESIIIEDNQVKVMRNEELYYTMEFDIKDQQIIPQTVVHYNIRSKNEYHYKEYHTIDGNYIPKIIEARSYQHGYVNNDFQLTFLIYSTLTQLKPLQNIDDSDFDILIPPGTKIKDKRTGKEYIAEVNDENEFVSLVDFAKTIEGGEE